MTTQRMLRTPLWLALLVWIAAATTARAQDVSSHVYLFDIDKNVLNLEPYMRIRRFVVDPKAPVEVYEMPDTPPGEKPVRIKYRRRSADLGFKDVEGFQNARIRRLQTDGTPIEQWPEELKPYFDTELRPLFELPAEKGLPFGSRREESSVEPGRNFFLEQIKAAYRDGVLTHAPMWERLQALCETAEGAASVRFPTARKHSAEHFVAGFEWMRQRGLIKFVPTQFLAAGDPARNFGMNDPMANPAEYKWKDFERIFDEADAKGQAVEFSDDDFPNFETVRERFLAARRAGRWLRVQLNLKFTGTGHASETPHELLFERRAAEMPQRKELVRRLEAVPCWALVAALH